MSQPTTTEKLETLTKEGFLKGERFFITNDHRVGFGYLYADSDTLIDKEEYVLRNDRPGSQFPVYFCTITEVTDKGFKYYTFFMGSYVEGFVLFEKCIKPRP